MIDGEIATGCLIAKNNAPGVFVHAKPYGAKALQEVHQEIEDGKTMQTLDIYSKKIGRKYIIHSSMVTV